MPVVMQLPCPLARHPGMITFECLEAKIKMPVRGSYDITNQGGAVFIDRIY